MHYLTCPECNYTRLPTDQSPPGICPSCGLVFWKWERFRRYTQPGRLEASRPIGTDAGKTAVVWRQFIWDFIGHCPETDGFAWTGRLLLFLVLCAWGGRFFQLGPSDSAAIGSSFFHQVNLVFHEAGHVVFSPFGDFLHVLGGSLGQLLMPLIVMLTFLLKERDPFAAAVGLWWMGQSAMDVAIYINDARALALPLLGGGTGYESPERHDWNNLLTRLGLLERDHALAQATYNFGRTLILAAWLWGGQVLYRQGRRLLHGLS